MWNLSIGSNKKTVLPTPGICATMKPILLLPAPFGESEGKWVGGGGGGGGCMITNTETKDQRVL